MTKISRTAVLKSMRQSKIGNPKSKWLGFSVVAFAVVLAGAAAQAQPPKKAFRIGVLAAPPPSFFSIRFGAFLEGLRDLGYVEGKNISIDYRYAEGKLDRLPHLAAELVHLKVEVILTAGEAGAQAAKNATGTIPIVFAVTEEAVASGLVSSLSRPGSLPVRGLDDFEPAFEAAKRDGAHALVTTPSPVINTQQRRVLDFTAKNRLPAIYAAPEFVDAGGLMYYGPSYLELFRRAATYADKILKGAKPADLPVEQPTKFELIINLRTAKQIGLTIPPNVLARADKVIK